MQSNDVEKGRPSKRINTTSLSSNMSLVVIGSVIFNDILLLGVGMMSKQNNYLHVLPIATAKSDWKKGTHEISYAEVEDNISVDAIILLEKVEPGDLLIAIGKNGKKEFDVVIIKQDNDTIKFSDRDGNYLSIFTTLSYLYGKETIINFSEVYKTGVIQQYILRRRVNEEWKTILSCSIK